MKKIASSIVELLALILVLLPTIVVGIARLTAAVVSALAPGLDWIRDKLGLDDVEPANWITAATDWLLRVYN